MYKYESRDLEYVSKNDLSKIILLITGISIFIILLLIASVVNLFDFSIETPAIIVLCFILFFTLLKGIVVIQRIIKTNNLITKIKERGKKTTGIIANDNSTSKTINIGHGRLGNEKYTINNKFYIIEYNDETNNKKVQFATPASNIKNPQNNSCEVFLFDNLEYAEN